MHLKVKHNSTKMSCHGSSLLHYLSNDVGVCVEGILLYYMVIILHLCMKCTSISISPSHHPQSLSTLDTQSCFKTIMWHKTSMYLGLYKNASFEKVHRIIFTLEAIDLVIVPSSICHCSLNEC